MMTRMDVALMIFRAETATEHVEKVRTMLDAATYHKATPEAENDMDDLRAVLKRLMGKAESAWYTCTFLLEALDEEAARKAARRGGAS